MKMYSKFHICAEKTGRYTGHSFAYQYNTGQTYRWTDLMGADA